MSHGWQRMPNFRCRLSILRPARRLGAPGRRNVGELGREPASFRPSGAIFPVRSGGGAKSRAAMRRTRRILPRTHRPEPQGACTAPPGMGRADPGDVIGLGRKHLSLPIYVPRPPVHGHIMTARFTRRAPPMRRCRRRRFPVRPPGVCLPRRPGQPRRSPTIPRRSRSARSPGCSGTSRRSLRWASARR